MRLSAWRITTSKHAQAAFSGEGAKLYPGRWNSAGVAVVYTAGSISLAILEVLVHLREATVLPDLRIIPVEFDDSLVESLKTDRLPRNWRSDPPPARLKQLGDEWVREMRSAILRVPSAITEEPNYLLSPGHPDFGKLRISGAKRLTIDTRLLPESVLPKAKTKRKR